MKNLVLGSLVALAASQVAGCIITSNNPPPDNAHIGATWKFHDVATNSDTSCPGGQFTTAALYTQQADSTGRPIGTCVQLTDVSGTCNIDLFNCGDMHGTSAPLVPDNWLTWIQIENDSGSQVYAKSVPALLDITNIDLTYNTQILNDGGYFRMAWTLIGASSNQPVTCAQAGAVQPGGGVEAVVSVSSTMEMHSDLFNCEDGAGYTAGYKAGTYQVSVDALNTSMQAVGTAPTINNKTIGPMNQVTDLGTVTIPITGK